MKKLFTLLATVTLSVMLFAQAPQTFSYQTVIRDNNWQTIANQNVSIEIAIREDAANGTIIYKEAHSSTTNDLGLVNLAVGGGGVVSGSWANIDWGNHSYFIQVAVDVLAGVNYIVMGTTQLRSVPYALYAENAGSSTPGPQGATGPIGLTGAQGPIGLTGAAGTNGTNGATGPQGPIGLTGATGSQGPIGLTGATGAAGTNGTNGVDGNDGAQGPIGLTGAAGATGPQGPIGLTGATGADGTNGNDGAQGPIGLTGAAGATGPQGPIGLTGPAGIDAVVDYDSLANLISSDSSFAASVSGGIGGGGGSSASTAQFNNQISNYNNILNGSVTSGIFNYLFASYPSSINYTVPAGKIMKITDFTFVNLGASDPTYINGQLWDPYTDLPTLFSEGTQFQIDLGQGGDRVSIQYILFDN